MNGKITYQREPNRWSIEKFRSHSGGVAAVFLNYNKRQTIEKAVAAVLEQDFPLLDIYFMDDVSTDGSFEVMEAAVKKYRGRHRVTVVKNSRNVGIAGQWNQVSKLSRATWFGMFCADDIAHLDRVSVSDRIIKKYPSARGVCTSRAPIDFRTGEKLGYCRLPRTEIVVRGTDDPQSIDSRLYAVGCTSFWHRSLFENNLPAVMLDDEFLKWTLHLKEVGNPDPVWVFDGLQETVDYSIGDGVSSTGRLVEDANRQPQLPTLKYLERAKFLWKSLKDKSDQRKETAAFSAVFAQKLEKIEQQRMMHGISSQFDIKVSVVIPVYNVKEYIGKCLDSIRLQSMPALEVICVDDGSSDGTAEILDRYVEMDKRFHVIHQENQGAGPSRNAGIRLAQGEYLLFSDPDDFIKRDTLEKLVQQADAHQADVVAFCMCRYDSSGEKCKKVDRHPAALLAMPEVFSLDDVCDDGFRLLNSSACCKLFRRSLVISHAIEFQSLPRFNDVAFVYSALALAKRIHVDNHAYYCYREGRAGSSQSTVSQSDPRSVSYAYIELKRRLVRAGRYRQLAKGYAWACYAANRFVLFKQEDRLAFREFYNYLCSDEGKELWTDKLLPTDFKGRIEYQRYQDFLSGNGFDYILGEYQYQRRVQAAKKMKAQAGDVLAKGHEAKGIALFCKDFSFAGRDNDVRGIISQLLEKMVQVYVIAERGKDCVHQNGMCVYVVRNHEKTSQDSFARLLGGGLIDVALDFDVERQSFADDIRAAKSFGVKYWIRQATGFIQTYLGGNSGRELPFIVRNYTLADCVIAENRVEQLLFSGWGCKSVCLPRCMPFVRRGTVYETHERRIGWVEHDERFYRTLRVVFVMRGIRRKHDDCEFYILIKGLGVKFWVKKMIFSLLAMMMGSCRFKVFRENVDKVDFLSDVGSLLIMDWGYGVLDDILMGQMIGIPVLSPLMPCCDVVDKSKGVIPLRFTGVRHIVAVLDKLMSVRAYYNDMATLSARYGRNYHRNEARDTIFDVMRRGAGVSRDEVAKYFPRMQSMFIECVEAQKRMNPGFLRGLMRMKKLLRS